MAENKFRYRIEALDDSAKGINSAKKRIGGLNSEAKRYTSNLERAGRRSPLDHATKSFAGVHASAFRALGGGTSPLKAATERLGAIREAGSAARLGMAEATEGAGALSGAMGLLGVATGGVAGVLVAAGLAGFKFASGWVEGAAGLGRLSQSLGIATEDIQKFQAAGELVGIDKGDAAGALGGVGSALHSAAYGGNNEVLAANARLGLHLNKGKDGLPDLSDFTLQLADVISKYKDPYTQAHIAQIYGVSALLPLLRKGRAGLQGRLDSAGQYAPIVSKEDTVDAARIQSETIEARQAAERKIQSAQAGTARLGEGAVIATRDLARGVVDATSRAGVTRLADAAAKLESAVVSHLSPAASAIERGGHAILSGAQELVAYLEGKGLTHHAAVGMAAGAYAESGLDAHRQQKGGPAYGLFQWESTRRKQFQNWSGHDLSQSTWQEQADFAAYELKHGEKRAGELLAAAQSDREAGEIASRHFERPKDADGQARARGELAERVGAGDQLVRHRVDVEVHDHRTKAKVKSSSGQTVAIGHAMPGDSI